MKEKVFEQKVRSYLKKVGAYEVKYFGCGFSQSGVPDVLSCVNGQFVAIELKASTGRPSELQLHNLRRIHNAYGFAILVYPEDWDLLKRFIDYIANYQLGNALDIYRDVFVERFLDKNQ